MGKSRGGGKRGASGVGKDGSRPIKSGLLKASEVVDKWKSKRLGDSPEEEREVKMEKNKEEDAIRRLSIDITLLQKIRHVEGMSMISKRIPSLRSYCVRKAKPRNKTKTVMVLKPAHSDAEIAEIAVNYAGPRFTKDGQFIPHSILGSFHDFKEEAEKRGEFVIPQGLGPVPPEDVPESNVPIKACKPLKQWSHRLNDWTQTQQYLADKVQRPIGDMVMKTSDEYPIWVDRRRETTLALDTMVSGCGEKKKNLVFWKHSTQYGKRDDRTSIFSTLTKSETIEKPEIEFRQVPQSIKVEKENGKPVSKKSYTPYYTNYLQEQRENAKDIIHILNPHHPDLDDLMIKGKGQIQATKETQQGKITLHSPICFEFFEEPEGECEENLVELKGPYLGVGSEVLSQHNITGESPLKPLTLIFETEPGEKQMQQIPLVNLGSTSLYYDWERIPIENPLNIYRPRIQRFYFLSEDGVLPPGGAVDLSVLYKSDFPGNFKETWKLKTRPVLCKGADILISFRARTTKSVFHYDKINEIEKMLSRRETKNNVEKIIEVSQPERARSPIILDTFEEFTFNQENPKLKYHASLVEQARDLYSQVCDSGLLQDNPTENFTVHNMRKLIHVLDSIKWPEVGSENYTEIMIEKDNKRRLFTYKYHTLMTELSFKQPSPHYDRSHQRQQICFQVLQTMADDFTRSAYTMALQCNFPIKQEETEEVVEEKPDNKKKKKMSISAKPKKGQKEHLSTSPSKSPKGGKDSPQKDHPITPSPLPVLAVESFSPVKKETATPEQQEQHREKLYILAYSLLQDSLDRMEELFDGLNPKQEDLFQILKNKI